MKKMKNFIRNRKVFSVPLAESYFPPGLVGDGGTLSEEMCRWHKKCIFKILSSCTILSGYQGNWEEIREYGEILSLACSCLQSRNCYKHPNVNKPQLSGMDKKLNFLEV